VNNVIVIMSVSTNMTAIVGIALSSVVAEAAAAAFTSASGNALLSTGAYVHK